MGSDYPLVCGNKRCFAPIACPQSAKALADAALYFIYEMKTPVITAKVSGRVGSVPRTTHETVIARKNPENATVDLTE